MSIKRLITSVVGSNTYESRLKRLEMVCTEPVTARIINHREMWDPISEEEVNTGTVDEKFLGMVFLVGTPLLEYKYNGKVYVERYDVEHVDLLRDVLGDNYEVRVLVNPLRPREVKLDVIADMMEALK